MPGKIAYIMSRFPHLPETFILREMNALQKQGWSVSLYPLRVQTESVVHAEAVEWQQQLHQVPFMSGAVLARNGRACTQHPGLYAQLWWQTVREHASDPAMLVRVAALIPKAMETAALMQAEGVTHIHAHYATYPAFMAWLIHQLTGIAYSMTVHAHDIFVRTTMLDHKCQAASFIVAISDYNREYLADVVGSWVRPKTHIIHCGIDPDMYRPRTMTTAPVRSLQILHVGSLQPYKGQAYLVQACARLRQMGIPFHCRIIGGGAEQPRLQRLIDQLDLTDQVQLLGPRSQAEVAALLPTADCYVQPSIVTPSGKMEGIPVALMEALACCLPVVATNISGIPELIEHQKTGYLVPPADAQALADALKNIYECPGQAFDTAVAGRELVLNQFHIHHNVSALASLFRRYARKESLVFQSAPVKA